MKLQTLVTLATLLLYAFAFPHLASPESRSLAALFLAEDGQTAMQALGGMLEGLFKEEVKTPTKAFGSMRGCQIPTGPIPDTSAKMVYDLNHPYMDPGKAGPCPGLNTLASHGYIDRSGVDTVENIIVGVQEGFNMGYDFGSFLAYSAFIVDGNQMTCEMSIGRSLPDVPGLDTHGTFEGDASITRSDYDLGDNSRFNETLFQVLVDAANLRGGGAIDVKAAAYNRKLRIDDSIARNPYFSYDTPRFVGATAETGFMLAMFASDQTPQSTIPVTLVEARSFFQSHKFPEGFYRRQDPYDFTHVTALTYKLIDLVGVKPGNNNGMDNYLENTDDDKTFCLFYQKQANLAIKLNSDSSQEVKNALKDNLEIYYQTIQFVDRECPKVPYEI